MEKIDLGPVDGYLEFNGSHILLIAFQSAGRITQEEMPKVISGEIDQREVAEKHLRLNWKNINNNLNIPKVDILFVTDHLSRSYGWYVMDGGEFVHEEINASLSKFLDGRDYRKVVTFGSSKGGTAALLFGHMNEHVSDIISLVPQIKIGQYWRKYYKNSLGLISGSSDPKLVMEKLDKLLPNVTSRANPSGKRFILYTGTHDDQFREIMQYSNYLTEKKINSELYVNALSQKHTPLVTENLDTIYHLVESVTKDAPILPGRKVLQIQDSLTFLY